MQNDQIIIYQTKNRETAIDVRLENETILLTQAQMVVPFQRDQPVISRHIKNIQRE